jgi:hypothetical protein
VTFFATFCARFGCPLRGDVELFRMAFVATLFEPLEDFFLAFPEALAAFLALERPGRADFEGFRALGLSALGLPAKAAGLD